MNEQIIIGSDHGGLNLKNIIINHLKNQDYMINDFGCYENEATDYPAIAKSVAKKVAEKNCKGILVCGTGIGMSIAANKISGIRAANCSETYSAKMSRKHNDANILCLGERVIGSELALDVVDVWLNTEFEGGRHLDRINMI